MDILKPESCPYCGGSGCIDVTVSGHGCDGTPESCARNCPVPVQEQVQCKGCCGSGWVYIIPARPQKEPEKQRPSIADNELSF